MSDTRRYGLDDFLIAASGAGQSGFTATQSALNNLARCSVCPFWNACDDTRCGLMIPVEAAMAQQGTQSIQPPG